MIAFSRRLALGLVLAAGVSGAATAQTKRTLVVAEPVHGTGYLPLYVAIHKGFFASENLDVKILTVESGSGHTNATLTGQAFAFIGGPEHNAFAKLKGGELRGVVNVVDRGNVYLVARKGVDLKPGQSIADFMKGKTVATGFYSGTPNSITRYLAGQWKLDLTKDIQLREMANGAILAAVKAGGAQIGMTSEPILTRGVVEGIWSEPFYNIPKELGPYAYSTLNIRAASIKEEPEVVAAFVRGVVKGLKHTYADREDAAAIAKKEFPTMALSDLNATLDRSFKDEIWSKDGMISEKSWTTGEAVVMEAGILKKPVPYSDIIDMQFVRPTLANN